MIIVFLFYYKFVENLEIAPLSNIINISGSSSSYIFSNETTLKIFQYGSFTLKVNENIDVYIKLFGAGAGSNGGKGGYSKGKITLTTDKTYIIWVGQGGSDSTSGSSGTFGGGGLIGKTATTTRYISTGGGLTGLFLTSASQGNALIIAGGGGGGVWAASVVGIGGNGGGISGGNAIHYNYPKYAGSGGTQISGGAAGTGGYGAGISGSQLQGGKGADLITTQNSGASGGGGYWGGGSGNKNNPSGGPGGGGSGFININFILEGSTSTFISDIDNIYDSGNIKKPGLFIIHLIKKENNIKKSNSKKYNKKLTFLLLEIILIHFY